MMQASLYDQQPPNWENNYFSSAINLLHGEMQNDYDRSFSLNEQAASSWNDSGMIVDEDVQQQWRHLHASSPLSCSGTEECSFSAPASYPTQFDHGYQSCSSPEQEATVDCGAEVRGLSDLECLSLEELRAFPATTLTPTEMNQLFQEQRHQRRPARPSSALSPKTRRLGQKKPSPAANKQHQLLWQFLYAAAVNPAFKDAIEMEDIEKGSFAIKDKRRFEEAWAVFKGNQKKVRYDYITRNMRHLYREPHHYLTKVVGQQHKYRFLYSNIEQNYGSGWRTAVRLNMEHLTQQEEVLDAPLCKLRSNSAPAPLGRRDSVVDIENLLGH